jgi:hypothetical protein
LYLVLYLFILLYPVWRLRNQPIIFVALLSILLGNSVLHIFENSTVALYWCLIIFWGLVIDKKSSIT